MRNPYAERALHAVSTPGGPQMRTGAPAAHLLTERCATAVHALVHGEAGVCDDLSITVERVRRDWAASAHGLPPEAWFFQLSTRLGRIGEDLERLRVAPGHTTTRRCAQESLVQLSALAQALAQDLADMEHPA